MENNQIQTRVHVSECDYKGQIDVIVESEWDYKGQQVMMSMLFHFSNFILKGLFISYKVSLVYDKFLWSVNEPCLVFAESPCCAGVLGPKQCRLEFLSLGRVGCILKTTPNQTLKHATKIV